MGLERDWNFVGWEGKGFAKGFAKPWEPVRQWLG